MLGLAIALHILGAVVWVGGMFAIYVCLRPALGILEPPQRLRLMRATLQKFFPWVWIAIVLLLASGYWMVFTTFGGFARAGLYIHLMQGIGWVMIALFVWLFHGPWLAFKRAVEARGLAARRRKPQPHPPDHRRQPAARLARHRHRRQRALLGLIGGRFSGTVRALKRRLCPKPRASPPRSRGASAPCRNWCRRGCVLAARISSPPR